MRKKLVIQFFTILILILFSGCNIFNLLGNNVNTQNTNTSQNINVHPDYEDIIKNGGAEVSAEMNEEFKKLAENQFNGKDYTPVVYCENLKKSASGRAYFCRTVETAEPDKPYWSIVVTDDERGNIGLTDAIDMQGSVLDNYSEYSKPGKNMGMAEWEIPESYVLTQDLIDDFDSACKNAKDEIFSFEPVALFGKTSAESGDYYAILCIKYFPDIEDSVWFAILYMRKNTDGTVDFLNASTILW